MRHIGMKMPLWQWSRNQRLKTVQRWLVGISRRISLGGLRKNGDYKTEMQKEQHRYVSLHNGHHTAR
jgi:hypothetical protein